MAKYDYYHILASKDHDGFDVKGYGTYGPSSVLAGQVKIVFLDHYDTVKEALEAYPTATMSNAWLEPVNTFDHLPDGPDLEWD